jgi:hypothetical protein
LRKPEFGRFSHTFGLVRSSPERAAHAFQTWQQPILVPHGLSFSKPEPQSGLLDDALRQLLPLTMPGMLRVLFWPVDRDWTVYFDNSGIGTEAATVMPVLSERLKVDAIRVGMSDEVRDSSTGQIVRYAATIFEYYSLGAARRVVFAANDGGRWKFDATGEPFLFEDLQQYTAKAIRDRFTQDMLRLYLGELGISLDDVPIATTQHGPGYAMHKLGKLPFKPKEY